MIKLPDFKYAGLSSTKIHRPAPPRFATIRLDTYSRRVLTPCVREGEQVLVGTKIADGADWSSAPLHSSVSGRVVELSPTSIRIESDESDRKEEALLPVPGSSLTPPVTPPEQLTELIRSAGIVNLGEHPAPIHAMLAEARRNGDYLVVMDGCESEPYLTADHLLMLNHPIEILKGTELLRAACEGVRAVIAIEDNKREIAELLNSKNYGLKIKTVEVKTVPSRYPQGSPRRLAETVTGKRIFRDDDLKSARVLVINAATAFAVYEAAAAGKPFYERVVTVTGPCILDPKNMWARIGTPVSDLIRAAKGFMRPPARLILGGPMTGRAVESLEETVAENTQAVIALPPDAETRPEEIPCTRCGLCVEVCPESLIPETLLRAVRKGRLDIAHEYGIDRCTECGACAYACPSQIPMVARIQQGKTEPAVHLPHLQHAADAAPLRV